MPMPGIWFRFFQIPGVRRVNDQKIINSGLNREEILRLSSTTQIKRRPIMRKKIIVLLFPALLLFATQAMATSFSLNPSGQDIFTGDSFVLDLNVFGLTDGAADSLGAFDLCIAYDYSMLHFIEVTFSHSLGDPDPDMWETDIVGKESVPGSVYLSEVSWLFDYELNVLQSDNFTLATLEFTGIREGTSVIEIKDLVASDALE